MELILNWLGKPILLLLGLFFFFFFFFQSKKVRINLTKHAKFLLWCFHDLEKLLKLLGIFQAWKVMGFWGKKNDRKHGYVELDQNFKMGLTFYNINEELQSIQIKLWLVVYKGFVFLYIFECTLIWCCACLKCKIIMRYQKTAIFSLILHVSKWPFQIYHYIFNRSRFCNLLLKIFC